MRRMIHAGEARLLARRLRIGLAVSVGIIAVCAAVDVMLHPDAAVSLALVKVAQLGIALGGILALTTQAGRRHAQLVGVAIVSGIYVTAAAAGIVRADASGTSVLLLTGVLASATILPWGLAAQLTTVAIAAAALAVTAASTPDGMSAVGGHRGLAFAVAFAGSLVLTWEHGRHRLAREHVSAVLTGHTAILEQITAGAPLDVVLAALAAMIEEHAGGLRCSILLLEGDTLRYGVAPSLPAGYRAATDGIVIGPNVGSCGTAAFRREPVIVVDIAADPLWEAFRETALGAGLRACWSAPIFGSDRACLGTFAMYYDEPRPPDPGELALIERAAHLAGVAIERHRHETALAMSRRRLEDESHVAHALMRAGQVMLASASTPTVLDRLSQLTTELLECDCSDTVVRADDGDAYVTGSAYGYPADEAAEVARLHVPAATLAPLIALLGEQGVAQVRTATVADPAATALLGAYGITRSLYVGLRRGDALIGFISAAYRGRTDRFTERQERVAVGIAQLASMALENVRLVEEAKRASQLKTEFVSTMSHELRTPLSVIIGYTDMLSEDLAPNEHARILAKVRGSSLELLDMIETTLNVSRLEAGKDQPTLERLSVPTLLDELAGEFSALPRGPETVLRWEPAPMVAIHSDRRKLRIVLKNLVGNALKFTPRGEVLVRCVATERECAISVRDTGVGIAREHLPVIFDMFRQGDSSDARSYGGVGLGLYIVRRLLTQLGGDVTVTSELGRGTTFTVTLPLADVLRATA